MSVSGSRAGGAGCSFPTGRRRSSTTAALADACGELRFEVDGVTNTAFVFRPGESCWVDKCTTPGIMPVNYCEGEELEPEQVVRDAWRGSPPAPGYWSQVNPGGVPLAHSSRAK